MKKAVLFITVITLLSSCASNKNESELVLEPSSKKERLINTDMVAIDMAAINYRLRGILLRNEKWQSLQPLTKETYKQKITQYQDSSELEYVEFVHLIDTELFMIGNQKNFAVCSRNVKMKLTICDRANTAMVDFINTDGSLINLASKASELLGEK